MWNYEKRLQYPVNITQTNPQIAQVIISQFGGPDGELSASMRYLSQRYTIPYREVAGLLTDIGREASEMVLHSSGKAFFRPACSKSAGGRFVVDASIAPLTLFAIANCHLYGSIFKYTSIWSLSPTTILSSNCV